MEKPRLIYYQDAHHFHAKRLDPPISIHKLQWPVNELLGTGVDLLVYGLGYGDVYFHDSKVGRVVGQKQEVWDSFIDWRIMRMVREAKDMGTDQLREVINRGHQTKLRVYPSLKLQSCDRPGSDRCGLLKWDRSDEVCLGEKNRLHPRFEFCYNYAHPDVREAKLSLVHEILHDYEADGIELDFMFVPKFFKTGMEDTRLMSDFVANVREIANQIGIKQKREIGVMVRVFNQRTYNLKLGLDIETWIKEESVNMVIGQVPDQFFDTELDATWLARAVEDTNTSIYIRPPRRIYDHKTSSPNLKMYRALQQTLKSQSIDGLYIGYLPWPFGEEEYQILRETADPNALLRRNKLYLLQPLEPGLTFEELLDYTGDWKELPRNNSDAFTNPPLRQLPVELKEGKPIQLTITVADDVESAQEDGDMGNPEFTIRFTNFCVEDEIEIRFNDKMLPIENAAVTGKGTVSMPVRPGRSPFLVPLDFEAHWFKFYLETNLLRQGGNSVEVLLRSAATSASFTRSISGLEIQTRYKNSESNQI